MKRKKRSIISLLLIMIMLSATFAPATTVPAASTKTAKIKVAKKAKKYKKTLYVGDRIKLKVLDGKKAVKVKKVKFKSSKKKVAPVTKKGILTAKKAGTTVVSVRFGKKKANITIIVKEKKKTSSATSSSGGTQATGSDPNAYYNLPDSDGDGIPDGWGIGHYPDGTSVIGPHASDENPDGIENGFWWYGDKQIYLKNYKRIKNQFYTIKDATFYFDKDGYMVTGKQVIDGKTYIFNDDGRLHDCNWQPVYETVPAQTHEEEYIVREWDEEVEDGLLYKCSCGETFDTEDAWKEHKEAENSAYPEKLKEAQSGVNSIESELSEKETAKENLEKAVAEKSETAKAKKETLDAENAKLAELDTALGTAKQNLETLEAEKAENDAAVEKDTELAENIETARAEMTQADANVAQTKNALDNAAEEIAKAENTYQAAKAEYETAKENTEAAKATYDSAQEQYNDGAFGFYQWQIDNKDENLSYSAYLGLGVLTIDKPVYDDLGNKVNGNFVSYTNKGDPNDATAIPNIYLALDYIQECNELREKENITNGLGEHDYLVGNWMMAAAQHNANYSRYSHKHSFYMSENLAWGYNPYKQWYYDEKEFYENNREAIEAGEADHNKYGHYLNLIDETFYKTGFGISYKDIADTKVTTFSQTFETGMYSLGSSRYKAYYAIPLEDYRALLDEYVASIGLDEKKEAYENALKAEEEKKSEMEKLEAQYESVKSGYEAPYNEALERQTAAKEAYDAAVTAREEYQTTLTAAKEWLAGYEAKHETAVQEKESATEAYNRQVPIVNSAKTACEAATKEAEDAATELETLNAEISEKEKELEKAKETLEKVQATEHAHDSMTTETKYKTVHRTETATRTVVDVPEHKEITKYKCSICGEEKAA